MITSRKATITPAAGKKLAYLVNNIDLIENQQKAAQTRAVEKAIKRHEVQVKKQEQFLQKLARAKNEAKLLEALKKGNRFRKMAKDMILLTATKIGREEAVADGAKARMAAFGQAYLHHPNQKISAYARAEFKIAAQELGVATGRARK